MLPTLGLPFLTDYKKISRSNTSLIFYFFLSSRISKSVPLTNFSLSSFSFAAFPRVVKPDFVRTDIFFGSFCAERKNGNSEHREAKNGRKKGEKKWQGEPEGPKRAMRVLNDLRGPQLVELFVLPVKKDEATSDTRERSG